MAELKPNTIVKDGTVYGTVSTNKVGSECEFPICSLEDWYDMTDFEVDDVALEAMWESGKIHLSY